MNTSAQYIMRDQRHIPLFPEHQKFSYTLFEGLKSILQISVFVLSAVSCLTALALLAS